MCAQIQEQPLHYLHLATLREYLRFEFADLTGLDVTTNRTRLKYCVCTLTLCLCKCPRPVIYAHFWMKQRLSFPCQLPLHRARVTGNAKYDPNLNLPKHVCCTGPDAPPPPQLQPSASGEADKENSEVDGSSASSPAAANGKEQASEPPGKKFDFERILEDFVLLTFLVRAWQEPCHLPPELCLSESLPAALHNNFVCGFRNEMMKIEQDDISTSGVLTEPAQKPTGQSPDAKWRSP